MPSPQRVLHGVDVGTAPRRIAAPAAIDDPAVRALVDQEAARARELGLQEGLAQGRADAQAAATVLADGIAQALVAATAASEHLAEHLAGRISGLAVDVAATVVAGLDAQDNGLLERVKQTLRVVDDRPLTVHVHPEDVAAIEAAAPEGVSVRSDTTLLRGEARVDGRWADADLTWDAVWASVREVLDAE